MAKKPIVSKAATNTLTQKIARLEKIRVANDKSKILGVCISCDMRTVLVRGVDLCGPCCWGESETFNGNW